MINTQTERATGKFLHAFCHASFFTSLPAIFIHHNEKLPVSFRFHLFFASRCLNVNEWASPFSVLLEVRDSFEREWRFCRLHRISAARHLAKSIAANEELTEWKPQFTLNNVQEGFLCFVNDMMEKYCWYSKILWGLLLFLLIVGAAGGGETLREIKEYCFHISFLVFLPLYSLQICSRYPL